MIIGEAGRPVIFVGCQMLTRQTTITSRNRTQGDCLRSCYIHLSVIFIKNKLLCCVTSISYGNRGCWQACYLCLLAGTHKTLANTLKNIFLFGDTIGNSHASRFQRDCRNCVNMKGLLQILILADMSSYANSGNIIGTLSQRGHSCHQQARCNGNEGAKNASTNQNLTATIARISLPVN